MDENSSNKNFLDGTEQETCNINLLRHLKHLKIISDCIQVISTLFMLCIYLLASHFDLDLQKFLNLGRIYSQCIISIKTFKENKKKLSFCKNFISNSCFRISLTVKALMA